MMQKQESKNIAHFGDLINYFAGGKKRKLDPNVWGMLSFSTKASSPLSLVSPFLSLLLFKWCHFKKSFLKIHLDATFNARNLGEMTFCLISAPGSLLCLMVTMETHKHY